MEAVQLTAGFGASLHWTSIGDPFPKFSAYRFEVIWIHGSEIDSVHRGIRTIQPNEYSLSAAIVSYSEISRSIDLRLKGFVSLDYVIHRVNQDVIPVELAAALGENAGICRGQRAFGPSLDLCN